MSNRKQKISRSTEKLPLSGTQEPQSARVNSIKHPKISVESALDFQPIKSTLLKTVRVQKAVKSISSPKKSKLSLSKSHSQLPLGTQESINKKETSKSLFDDIINLKIEEERTTPISGRNQSVKLRSSISNRLEVRGRHRTRLSAYTKRGGSYNECNEWAYAPAFELKEVWDKFHYDNLFAETPLCLINICEKPQFTDLKVICLEDQRIEQIFEVLLPCENLIAVYLAGNNIITRDLPFITHFAKLRKADLSRNRIHYLPENNAMTALTELESLLLQKNDLVGWSQLEQITQLIKLRQLSLEGNPCSKIKDYKDFIINKMPQLWVLDGKVITDFDHEGYISKHYLKEVRNAERAHEFLRFTPYNKDKLYWTPWPLPDTYPEDTYSAEGITQYLNRERAELRKQFEYMSPILTIQKNLRMFMQRGKYNAKKKRVEILYWAFRRYHLRFNLYKIMQKLELSADYLKLIGRARFIQKYWKAHLHRKKYKTKVALMLQSLYQMKKTQNETLATILGLNSDLFQLVTRPGKERDSQNSSISSIEEVPGAEKKFFPIRILLSAAQQELIEKLGIDKKATHTEESRVYKIKQDAVVNPREFRLSPILAILKWAYKFIDVVNLKKKLYKTSSSRYTSKNASISSKNSSITKRSRISTKNVTIKSTKSFLKKINQEASKNRRVSLVPDGMTKLKPRVSKYRKTLAQKDTVHVEDLSRTSTIPSDLNMFNLQSSKGLRKSVAVSPVKKFTLSHSNSRKTIRSTEKRGLLGLNDMKSNIFGNPETDLIAFSFSSKQDLLQVVRSIVDYNRKADYPLMVFYEPILIRVKAAHKIQSWWRGSMFRLRQKRIWNKTLDIMKDLKPADLEGHSNNTYAKFAVANRAAQVIQTSFNNWRLRQRIATLAAIARYVSDINTDTLYLEQNIYLNLDRIVNIISKHHDQSSYFYERRFNFFVQPENCVVKAKYMNRHRYALENFPSWFNKRAGTYVPVGTQDKKKKHDFSNNILSLIHQLPSSVPQPYLVNYYEINEDKHMSQFKLKFVKVQLQSITEAKNRAAILALLSANYLKGKGGYNFIQFQTQDQLKHPQRSLVPVQQIWCFYNIPEKDAHQFVNTNQVLEKQAHAGIILKKHDPYVTILRARPRLNRQGYERVIVLENANPEIVKERVGSAIIRQNQTGVFKQKMKEVDASIEAQRLMFQAGISSANEPLDEEVRQLVDGSFNFKQTDLMQVKQSDTGVDSSAAFDIVNKYLKPRDVNSSMLSVLSPSEQVKMAHKKRESVQQAVKLRDLQDQINSLREKVEQQDKDEPGFKRLFLNKLIPATQKSRPRDDKLEGRGVIKTMNYSFGDDIDFDANINSKKSSLFENLNLESDDFQQQSLQLQKVSKALLRAENLKSTAEALWSKHKPSKRPTSEQRQRGQKDQVGMKRHTSQQLLTPRKHKNIDVDNNKVKKSLHKEQIINRARHMQGQSFLNASKRLENKAFAQGFRSSINLLSKQHQSLIQKTSQHQKEAVNKVKNIKQMLQQQKTNQTPRITLKDVPKTDQSPLLKKSESMIVLDQSKKSRQISPTVNNIIHSKVGFNANQSAQKPSSEVKQDNRWAVKGFNHSWFNKHNTTYDNMMEQAMSHHVLPQLNTKQSVRSCLEPKTDSHFMRNRQSHNPPDKTRISTIDIGRGAFIDRTSQKSHMAAYSKHSSQLDTKSLNTSNNPYENLKSIDISQNSIIVQNQESIREIQDRSFESLKKSSSRSPEQIKQLKNQIRKDQRELEKYLQRRTKENDQIFGPRLSPSKSLNTSHSQYLNRHKPINLMNEHVKHTIEGIIQDRKAKKALKSSKSSLKGTTMISNRGSINQWPSKTIKRKSKDPTSRHVSPPRNILPQLSVRKSIHLVKIKSVGVGSLTHR